MRAARRAFLATTAGVAMLAVAAAPALAQQAVGKAAQIKNQVSGSVGKRSLSVADPVYRAERISAGPASFGEMLLIDDSKVLVGENSEISLDNFVVSGGGIRRATLNVAKGAFRFISNGKDDSNYQIRTPLSTIGVRGTLFDVYVANGLTRVVLLQGAVSVCNNATRQCLIADRSCDVIEVTPAEVEEAPFFLSNRRTPQQATAEFSLLFGQQRFNGPWRAPTFSCNARAAQEAAAGAGRTNPNVGKPDPIPEFSPPDDEGECEGYC